ncbi:MAG: ubiquinone/menaquinone biosynthesis methyltransferase [Bacteroidales bacterium]|nr:ubiquinone/menaquinone biosynthesis methyltransferase [Bacteroidales bacterium]
MSRSSSDFPLKDFYSNIYATYDRVNRIFTFGRDVAWRRMAVDACLQSDPGSVLDVCTGTGDFILEVARQTAKRDRTVILTGYDFSGAMLQEARRKRDLLKTKNAEIDFIEGDVDQMPFEDNRFDAMGITFGIRNLVYENSNAERHLQELYRVLRPGGRFIILESSKPENRFWRLFNNIYLQFILPILGGILSGNLKAYRYLEKSSRNYYSVREMGDILEGTGFRMRGGRSLFLGSVMLLVAEK